MAGISVKLMKDHSTSSGYIPAFEIKLLTPLFEPLLQATIPYRVRTAPILTAINERVRRPQMLLDIGCGGGLLLQEIGQVADDLIGIEIDPDALVLAARKRIPNLSLIHASAVSVPLASLSIDVIVSRLVFHHLTRQEKEGALKEMHRVLISGGLFVLADWGKPRDLIDRILSFSVRVSDGDKRTIDNLKGRLPYLMQEAGFTDIRETSISRTLFGTFKVITAVKV
ncbi:MAG: class I SAM-dependent methyltransferase [Blastocatellia bacterium]|nr:class I SAM-dependent methyltransferase [Blastocatellia bacterium]